MNRVCKLFVVIFALFAVAMPSVSLGARGVVEHPAPLLQLRADGGHVKVRCPLGGTGRLLCTAELGVMPIAPRFAPKVAQTFPRLRSDIMPAALALEPGLPPPRRG